MSEFEYERDPEEVELSGEDEAEAIFRKLDQDRVNDARLEWRAMYGFDHECSCATDIAEGNTVVISKCYAGVANDALNNLRRVRAFLYAIASSPTEEASILKALAAEAFHGAT